MTVLQVCAYGAENKGNFIASLEALENKLKENGVKTIYAFVERAADKQWCKEIQNRTRVYFLPEAKARIRPDTYRIFKQIYAENDICIVHTHFELYDIPATVTAPKNMKIFWHLHDPIVVGGGLRGLLWRIQYGIVGKRAKLLSVSEYYKNVVIGLGFSETQAVTVLNGIDLERVGHSAYKKTKQYDFLTFGWDFYRKGDDLILDACNRLEQEGYSFKLLLNGGEETWRQVDTHLSGREPSYLEKGMPVDDVGKLFEETKVFIQASRRETFSYAVCEATYAGLPVICSDIPGLEWAHQLPTVRFFECDNSDMLYQLMKDSLTLSSITEVDILTAKNIIESQFSISTWITEVIDIYGI